MTLCEQPLRKILLCGTLHCPEQEYFKFSSQYRQKCVYNCTVCTTSLPVLAGKLERLFQGNEGPPKFFSEGVYRESIFRILLEDAVFSVSSYPYRPSVCGWSTGRSCPARPSCEQPRCGGRWALSSGIPWFSPALWGLRIVSTHCSSFLLFQGSRVSNETCPLYF